MPNELVALVALVHLSLWAMQGYYNDQWNPLKMYTRPKKGGK